MANFMKFIDQKTQEEEKNQDEKWPMGSDDNEPEQTRISKLEQEHSERKERNIAAMQEATFGKVESNMPEDERTTIKQDSQMSEIAESPEKNLNPTDTEMEQYEEPPQPMFSNDPKVLKILVSKHPMEMSGPVLLSKDRKVLWRNLCMIGKHHIECVVEMSLHKSKFYIVALDLFANRYHVVDMWLQQATKLVRACDQDLEKVMKMLDFKLGKLYIKHQEILIQFETYMPEKVSQLMDESRSRRKLTKTASRFQSSKPIFKSRPKLPMQMSKNPQRTPQASFSLCRSGQEFKLQEFMNHYQTLQDQSEIVKQIKEKNKEQLNNSQSKMIKSNVTIK